MKRCFAYIRVSTVKQGEGVSLEAQREAISVFASHRNLEITQWFEEKETAAKKGRAKFNQVIRLLRQGKADGLIVHRIDRSARNLADWARIGELADTGIDIHFATESLDFRSRGGRLAADVQAVVAADYVRNLREETIKGIQGRLKQGLYPFRAPIGYLDNGKGKPKTLDPLRAPLVKKAFELYASRQYSYRTLLPELRRQGLKGWNGGPLSMHGLETMLANPFYAGVIQIKKTGATYRGIHEALISSALFERVQAVKSGKAGPKVTRHNHTYQGLFRCGLCDGPMVPELQKQRVYYRCQRSDCETTSVREDRLIEAIENCLAKAQLTPVNARDAAAAIDSWVAQELHDDDDRGLSLRRSNLVDRKNRLTDALVDGLIDKDAYRERKQALALEEEALRQECERSSKKEEDAEQIKTVLELTKTLQRSHQMGNRPQRRQIVELTTSNRRVVGKEPYLEPQNWLRELKSAATTSDGAPSRSRDRTLNSILDGYLEARRKSEEDQQRREASMHRLHMREAIGTP